VASPSLRFLASFLKFGYRRLILFHREESAAWQSIPSQFLPSACHVRSFVSSVLANKCLNLGMIGRYHNTFDEGPFVVLSSLLHSSSSFTLYRDTPHLGAFMHFFILISIKYTIIKACMYFLILHTDKCHISVIFGIKMLVLIFRL